MYRDAFYPLEYFLFFNCTIFGQVKNYGTIGAMNRASSYILIRALTLIIAGACLTPVLFAQSPQEDPFIEVNRNVYKFNEVLDTLIIKPVTKCYDVVVPDVGKRGVTNFFNNIDDVNVVFNDLLQFKMKNAVQDSGRLVINTTIGVGGLIDVATQFGLYKNYEDFGQTLGYWGFDSGPYMVLPFFGSSSVRDTIGLIPDYLMNPVFWINDDATRHSVYALETVDTRLYYMAAESMITGDEYTFVRDAYLQRREYQVADGEIYDEFDDY